jgi:predicted ATP-dependent serine protease
MKSKNDRKLLAKSPTGIPGLDEITGGGFPTGRPTLLCGNAGCGKTLLAMEFLIRGATVYNEPGVFKHGTRAYRSGYKKGHINLTGYDKEKNHRVWQKGTSGVRK